MHIPPWVYAALDGFTLGGLLSTGRPSAPTSIFPEKGHEQEAMDQFVSQYPSGRLTQALLKQL
jgi:hypothetical protein